MQQRTRLRIWPMIYAVVGVLHASASLSFAFMDAGDTNDYKLHSFEACMQTHSSLLADNQNFFVNTSLSYADYATGPKARIDRKPAGVFFATTEEDVIHAVQCAVANDVAPVPRSGGHSYEVLSSMDGSIVIDLAEMNAVQKISTDTKTQTAIFTVEGGARLGHVYKELDRLGGYNFNAGTCPGVGIGGHISGGGYGMVSRYYGLAADLTTALRVVLFNGTVVTATKESHSDLFWALRGGGAGSFGIITKFSIQAHKVPQSTMFTLTFNPNVSAQVLRTWMEFFSTADKRMTTQLMVGKEGSTLKGQFMGSLNETNALLDSSKLFTFGGVTSDIRLDNCSSLDTKAYMWSGKCDNDHSVLDVPKHLTLKDKDYSKTKAGYGKTILTDVGAQLVVDWAQQTPSTTWSFIQFEVYGGIFATQKNDMTPWAHRNAAFSVQIGVGAGKDEPETSTSYMWINGIYDALLPYLDDGNYQNYCDLDLGENFGELYWGADNFERLKQIKKKYDPQDIFHSAQSIPLPE